MQIPVIMILMMESGIKTLQPKFINWSYLNLGIVQRTHMKKKMKKNIFPNRKMLPAILSIFGS